MSPRHLCNCKKQLQKGFRSKRCTRKTLQHWNFFLVLVLSLHNQKLRSYGFNLSCTLPRHACRPVKTIPLQSTLTALRSNKKSASSSIIGSSSNDFLATNIRLLTREHSEKIYLYVFIFCYPRLYRMVDFLFERRLCCYLRRKRRWNAFLLARRALSKFYITGCAPHLQQQAVVGPKTNDSKQKKLR
jgi:hypothetical protein